MALNNAEAVFGVVDRAFKVIAWNVSAAVASKATEDLPGWQVHVGYWTIFALANLGAFAFAGPYFWSVSDEIWTNLPSRGTKMLVVGCFWVMFTCLWVVIYFGVKQALTSMRL